MPIKFPEISFDNIVKSPLTYALVIIVSLLFYFVSAYNNNNKDERDFYKQLYLEERSKNDNLNRELLIKNRILEGIPETVDSLAKAKVEKYKK